MSLAVWWRGLADGSRTGFAEFCLKVLLLPVSLCYSLALRLRGTLYAYGLLPAYRLPCPVISIGNITVGGTGKTPATALVAQELQRRGHRVAIISRGYGGSLKGRVGVVSDGAAILLTAAQAGDEPYLLARSLPGTVVVIGADRYRAGRMACERFKPDLLLLDDGFQHIRLKRDLNILLLDSRRPFGNGWTLPFGLLREPLSAVRRADLVIFTRCQPGRQPAFDVTVPYCCSEHCLTGFNRLTDGGALSCDTLQRGRVAAFAAIAEPEAFFESLRQMGLNLAATLALPDHTPYHHAALARLDAFATAASADWLLTTEKDGVKLREAATGWKDKIVTARLELVLHDRGMVLQRALDTCECTVEARR